MRSSLLSSLLCDGEVGSSSLCLCRMERLAVVEVIRLVDDGEGIGRGDAAILVLSMMGQEGREARGEVSGEAG